jgi:competence protein ComEA
MESTRTQSSWTGWAARVRAWAGGSAWLPLVGKLAGYVAGFVALALVGSGAASWRLGASGGALAMGLGPASPPPPASSDAPPAPAAAAALGATEHEAPHEPGADAGAPDAAPSADAGSGTGGITPDGRVILNAATEEELRRLPGVGPSKARAIVALRTKLGKLKRAEDLLRVKGIGRRSLARMRPLLVVDAP